MVSKKKYVYTVDDDCFVSCGSPCSMLFTCCYWWFPVLQL
ncbi:hypothetical protein ES332_D06G164100v1 [Gossypium tomentosum]|uniref:Uncharacterized protein n=1 Tax=Gossypium tomentosum TaxID=34277 RepID=A0A5D2KJW9_GOSTO|nr:hypothetical protein ES332_D06G164100v1 [Gossypium tomentosum]